MTQKNKHSVRVIPRLDIKGPNVVKGLQFDGNRVLGTPDVFAEIYYREGADELIFYDIVASLYQRNTLLEYIRKTAEKIFIPLTVAGGIRSIEDIREILRAGADKIAINTAAIANPNLIGEASRVFGSQCIMSGIEFHRVGHGRFEAMVDYGRQVTGVDAFDWARKAVDLGAGELLLTSIDNEGMGNGYDLEFILKVSEAVPVPVIACGGAGSREDVLAAIQKGGADAVSAASIFHYHYSVSPGDNRPSMSFNEKRLRMGENIDSGNIEFLKHGYGGTKEIMVKPVSLPELKNYLNDSGVVVRPTKQSFDLARKLKGYL
jgi:imidazole glycerol-phosphate synthase subunit HisF